MSAPSILIVVAGFYEDIAEELACGATARLEAAGVQPKRFTVPGALELPGAIAVVHEKGGFDGYVALGCVIRGETAHYDLVAGESARGLMDLTLRGVAVGNGILTVETREQAWARASVDGKNKGEDAAKAALALIEARNFTP